MKSMVKENKFQEGALKAESKKADLFELEIPNGFECAISLELMSDPVIAADGHSYERSNIEEWFRRGNLTSPKTNEKLAHQKLTPNVNLRQSIEDFKKLQATVKQIKLQEQQASQTAAEALAREQKLKTQYQEAKFSLDSQALLLTQQGTTRTGVLKTQQQLGQAVLAFVAAMELHIQAQSSVKFDSQAAMSIVGGIVSAIVKGGETYNTLLQKPEQYSVHPMLIPFIKTYVKEHPILWELHDQIELAKSIKASLYRGEIAALRQRFEEKPIKKENDLVEFRSK